MGRSRAPDQAAAAMIALVDCNNFFASCERLFRPDLTHRPVAVLSNNDGCIVARSEEVKQLGVPMGVPYFKVRDVIVKNNVRCFSSNFALYSNMSQRILGVLEQWSPQIEVYSIDEAFLELAQLPKQNLRHWGDRLRSQIRRGIGMPVSVGIAPTKTLAKLAGSYAKQHHQTCVLNPRGARAQYESVLAQTPIEAVWGIGWRLTPRFLKAGIHNALQLSQVSRVWLHAQMGVAGTKLLQELHGQPAHLFQEQTPPQKSLVASRSFGHTVRGAHQLEAALATFASQAAYRLRKHRQVTAQFGIYLRHKTAEGGTRGQSASLRLPTPSNDTSQLVQAALQLMQSLYDPAVGYKKAGVFAHHLSSAQLSQGNLFDPASPEQKARRQSFMRTLDSINQRYGSQTIQIGTIDPKTTQWRALKQRMSPAYTTDWNQLPLLYPLS